MYTITYKCTYSNTRLFAKCLGKFENASLFCDNKNVHFRICLGTLVKLVAGDNIFCSLSLIIEMNNANVT